LLFSAYSVRPTEAADLESWKADVKLARYVGMAFRSDWPSWWPFSNDWRRGCICCSGGFFLKDLFRKFLGNNMAVFFAKDVLTIVLYISFLPAPGVIVLVKGVSSPPVLIHS